MTVESRRPRSSPAPAIAVAVSTFNRADRLPRLVSALDAQDIDRPFEVVIVDNGSTDDTWDVLGRLAAESRCALRPVRLEANRGAARGRNTAWRATRAPVVAFTDDDCRPDRGWLHCLVDAFTDQDVDVVQGCTLADPQHEDRRGPFSHTMEMTSERGWYETCNIAYRHELLERLGGLDESWERTGEDTDMAYRAKSLGARTAFSADAVVYHEITASDVRARLRSVRRWDEVPRIVARHPQLRTELYHSRWFWRSSHPKAVEALVAVAVAVSPTRSLAGRMARIAVAAMLAHPYWHFRTEIEPLRAGPRRRRVLIPVAWVIDLAEVAVLAKASVRHRSLYL